MDVRPNEIITTDIEATQTDPNDGQFPKRFLPQIIYRPGWGARPPKETTPLKHPIGHLIYTYTGTDECHTPEECMKTVQELQKLHMGFGKLPDIKYNFLVGGDFNIYEGRGWNAKATKDDRMMDLDGLSLDVAFIGDFTHKQPPNSMYEANSTLLNVGLQNGFITPTIRVTPINDQGRVMQKTAVISASHPVSKA